jgi:regulator of protease activity HflC (stomatin/prohibitin superfamily)
MNNSDVEYDGAGLSLSKRKTALILLAIVLVIFAIIVPLTMVVSVGVGHAVVLVDPISKSISDPILGPTYAFKPPWVSAVDVYYATESYEATVPCFSSDQLEMEIGVLVRWSLTPNKIIDLYNNYPNMNYQNTAIESILEETMRLITKKYTALETIEFRDVVRNEIETTVLEELETEPSLAGALTGLEFDLKNIGYPEKYTSAIEDKLVAEQQKIQAEFEREKILILANATAQEVVIEALGEAEAKVIEANATRQAIELVLESVGQSGNETRIAELYLWVQTLQRIAPEVEILIVGTDGVPVLIPANLGP